MDFHSMKRKELQALCKKHKIPANLTNLEMASRLTSLLEGKNEFFAGRRSSLKALDGDGSENESNVNNKRVKKVRFSPETQIMEFQTSDAKRLEINRPRRPKSVINEVSGVDIVGRPELSEGVGYLTRSRGGKLVEQGVAKRKQRKRADKDDALGHNLPSADDYNEEGGAVTRRSLRNREVLDEKKGENEDVENAMKKKGRQRNPRQGNVKGRDDVDERGESDVACVEVLSENVLRRSKGNVTKVGDYKLLKNGTVARGRSFKKVAMGINEVSGPSVVDIDVGEAEKEGGSPVGVGMRRSRRITSRHEHLITLDDLIADANYERKARKRRRGPILEEEAVRIESITIELTPLSANRNEKAEAVIVAGKVAQKEKRRSKKHTEGVEDPVAEDLTTKELPDDDIQPSITQVAERTICRDSDDKGFIDNLKQQGKRSRKNSRKKSHPKARDRLMGVKGEVTASEFEKLNNDDVEPETETSQAQTEVVAPDVNVIEQIKKNSAEYSSPNSYSDEQEAYFPGRNSEQQCSKDVVSYEKPSMADSCVPLDQSDFTDPKGVQVWVELSVGAQRPASLDHVVEDEEITSERSQECIEQEGLDTVCDDVLEKYGNDILNRPCERDGFTCSIIDKTCEADPADSEDVMTAMVSGYNLKIVTNPNYNVDPSSTVDSFRALEQREPLQSMQKNGCEVDNVAGEGNFDHEEMKSTESAKSNEHNPLEENCDASEKCCDYDIPEPSRTVTSMVESGHAYVASDKCGESDFRGEHFGSPSTAANEFGAVSGTIIKTGQSFFQDTIVQIEGSKNSHEDEPGKDGNADLIESSFSETEKKDNKYGEPANSEVSEAAILSVTDNIVHIPPGDYTEISITSAIELDGTLEREQSSTIQMYCSEADNEADEEKALHQVELNRNELAESAENGHFEEQHHSPSMSSKSSDSHPPRRSSMRMLEDDIFNGGEDSNKCQKSTAGSRPENDESTGFIESCARKECTYAEKDIYVENPMNSEDAMAAMGRTCICGHASLGYSNDVGETTSTVDVDIAIEQREQSPVMHLNGFVAGSVAEADRNDDQVELKCDDLTKSADERPLEEQHDTPKESCILVSSIRSGRCMLWDETVGTEDSAEHQKNATDSKKSYEDEIDKDENDGFLQSCVRVECTTAKKDDGNEENPVNSDDAMEAMSSRTENFPDVSVLHTNEESTSTMNVDISWKQGQHSPILHGEGSEVDSVAEEDENCNQVELKYDENYQSPNKFSESGTRSILQDGEHSMKCQKNTTSSGKTYIDEPGKDGGTGFTDSCLTEKNIRAKNYESCEKLPINSEDPMEAVIFRTGDFTYIPLADNNKHTGSMNSDLALDQREQTGSMNSDLALDQREQSPILQMNGYDAENVAEEDRRYDQLELYCDESAECVEDRCLEEQYHFPNECLPYIVSDFPGTSASGMLQDDIVSSCEDSIKHQGKRYVDAPEADVGAGSVESYVIDKYNSAKSNEDNPEISKYVMEAITSATGRIPVADKQEDYISTMVTEITVKQREQSPTMRKNVCRTENLADDGNHENKDLSCDEFTESVENKPFEKKYHSLDKYWKLTDDPYGGIPECKIDDAGEDYSGSAELLVTSIMNPSLAAGTVERNRSATEFRASTSNFSTNLLDSSSPIDGPEEIVDTMVQLPSVRRNSVGAHDAAEDVKNSLEVASFAGGINDAEDVDARKFDGVVLDIERRASYVIEGDETFAVDREKESSDGISEKISAFTKDFRCIDKEEDNAKVKREYPPATFPQVQFTLSAIHIEEKIAKENQDDVASELYKHHEMLEESDVVDTINENIDSESTSSPLLRIGDTSDASHIDMLTKVAKPEAKQADETVDTTARKFEPSIEGDDQRKREAADIAETALGSAWISESKTASIQSKNSENMEQSFLDKQLKSETRKKNSRAILIHGTPKKLQMAADMKENVLNSKMEKVGSLTTVKPATKRPALKDLLQK